MMTHAMGLATLPTYISEYESVLESPKIPTEEELDANKIARIRNHQLLKITTQLILYSALLYLVYTISFDSRDPMSFYLKDHSEKSFQFTSTVWSLSTY